LEGAAASGLGVAGLALVGCGDDDDSSSGNQAASGDQTLTVAISAFPLGIDKDLSAGNFPTYESISQCYDTPIVFKNIDYPFDDEQGQGAGYLDLGELEPWQLEAWELTDNDSAVVMTIRKGIQSSNGNELTSADIAYTIDRAIALEFIGYFYNTLIDLDLENPYEIIDDYTIKVNATKANGLLFSIWNDLFMPFIDAETAQAAATEDDPWSTEFLASNCAGFGAYDVESWTPGQEVVWTANPNYFQDQPEIGRIIYRVIPESSVRLSALQAGDIDIAEDLSPDQWLEARDTDGVKAFAVRSNFVYFAYMNSLIPPFDDIRVRQALNIMMPRDQIAESVYLGLALPWRAALSTINPGANSDLWPFSEQPDAAAAQALLDDAGFGGGMDLELSYTTALPLNEQVANLVRASLSEIGVNLKLNPLPDGDMVDGTYGRTIPFGLWLDSPIGPDPIYGVFLYNYDPDTVSNHGQLDDPELQRLVDEAVPLTDLNDRIDASQAAQARALELSGFAPLVEPFYAVAMRENVEGFRWHNANDMYFRHLRKT
jgi:peptide/nickel transport system substrate-binding protein